MRRARRVLPVLALVLASCSQNPTGPTSPTSQPTGSTQVQASVKVTIDGDASATAIRAASKVTFDATASSGGGPLTYDVDFGDGAAHGTAAVATHSYTSAGAFTATVRVTSKSGDSATATKEVTVRSIEGPWENSQFNPAVNLLEARRLTITSQQDLEVRGTYFSSSAQADRAFSGTLGDNRSLHLVLDDGTIQFDGTVPASVNAPGTVIPFAVHGGSANGQVLPFVPASGEPIGPPPVASLTVKNDSFGNGLAIHNLSPVLYDGSASTGDHVSCVIDFGDGLSASDCAAVHRPVIPASLLTKLRAQLTVTDRFGRSSTAQAPVWVFDFASRREFGQLWRRFDESGAYVGFVGNLYFDRQDGLSLTGTYSVSSNVYGALTGELSGERDIRIVLDSGIVYTGTISSRSQPCLSCGYTGVGADEPSMTVKVQGGPDDGKTLKFAYYETY